MDVLNFEEHSTFSLLEQWWGFNLHQAYMAGYYKQFANEKKIFFERKKHLEIIQLQNT